MTKPIFRLETFGKICPKHPQSKGHRRGTNGKCTECIKAEDRVRAKIIHKNLKLETLQRYGSKCAICWERDIDVLTIDHINHNGASHRREINSGKDTGGSNKTYRWLKANGYPSGFRVLCFNCNIKEHLKCIRNLCKDD